jgi:hypothetical protein
MSCRVLPVLLVTSIFMGCLKAPPEMGCIAYVATNGKFENLPFEISNPPKDVFKKLTVSRALGYPEQLGFETVLVVGFTVDAAKAREDQIRMEVQDLVFEIINEQSRVIEVIIPKQNKR